MHSGYGFAIGNVAAFDMSDPEAVVSPGGVGFDINCGVRLIRTNLTVKDVEDKKEKLAQALFDHIPVGVGSTGIIPTTKDDLEEALGMGMDWSLREGYSWAEDKEHWCARPFDRPRARPRARRSRPRARRCGTDRACQPRTPRSEEYGRMLAADPSKVGARAKKRGLPQMGTLGAGNHYAEIQYVEEIYDPFAARKMGIDGVGQVCVMLHCGSRGLGHQVATDALVSMERAMARDGIVTNDRQLACARINSQEGQDYLAAMSCAANYAWVNRSSMTFLVRQGARGRLATGAPRPRKAAGIAHRGRARACGRSETDPPRSRARARAAFAKMFDSSPDDLDMHVVYDVSHNIAKVEEHLVDGAMKRLLVHRKGSTRAFPPHHPLIPVDYQLTGQPVLIGGTMGTCSYVLTGTDRGMEETFGSTCHGAGRAQSRNKSRNGLDYEEVLSKLKARGIAIRVASPKLVMEEAPESYKDVTDVVDTCHAAGISKKCVKLKPIAVVKG